MPPDPPLTAAREIRVDPLSKIANVVGPANLLTDTNLTARYLVDERRLHQGRARAVARPGSTDEMSRIVRICCENGIGMVPQGGNTGYCGGATPDDSGSQLVLSLERLNRVLEVDAGGHSMTLEAGVILANAQRAAAEHGLLFPLSMGSEGSCQIGGNLSTNAGGVAVLKYGTAGDLVLGLEVVLPDGRILPGLSALRKDNTGYDLKRLFLGAEGTLGIITAAVVKLFPRTRSSCVAWAAVTNIEAACELLARLRAESGDTVTSFEYVSSLSLAHVIAARTDVRQPLEGEYTHHVLTECATDAAPVEQAFATAMKDGLVVDATLAQSEAQRRAFWQIRESIPEAEKRLGGSIKHDVSVTIIDVPSFIERARQSIEAEWPDARLSIYGHIGDGNVHFNVLAPGNADAVAFKRTHGERISRIVHDLAHEMNGSFSAEHGIGQLKRNLLAQYAGDVSLDLMYTLKRALDPKGLMNPGKVVSLEALRAIGSRQFSDRPA